MGGERLSRCAGATATTTHERDLDQVGTCRMDGGRYQWGERGGGDCTTGGFQKFAARCALYF